jgi:hypothetical protein
MALYQACQGLAGYKTIPMWKVFYNFQKKCLIYTKNYITLKEVKHDVFEFVELFYNRKRMQFTAKKEGYKDEKNYFHCTIIGFYRFANPATKCFCGNRTNYGK